MPAGAAKALYFRRRLNRNSIVILYQTEYAKRDTCWDKTFPCEIKHLGGKGGSRGLTKFRLWQLIVPAALAIEQGRGKVSKRSERQLAGVRFDKAVEPHLCAKSAQRWGTRPEISGRARNAKLLAQSRQRFFLPSRRHCKLHALLLNIHCLPRHPWFTPRSLRSRGSAKDVMRLHTKGRE